MTQCFRFLRASFILTLMSLYSLPGQAQVKADSKQWSQLLQYSNNYSHTDTSHIEIVGVQHKGALADNIIKAAYQFMVTRGGCGLTSFNPKVNAIAPSQWPQYYLLPYTPLIDLDNEVMRKDSLTVEARHRQQYDRKLFIPVGTAPQTTININNNCTAYITIEESPLSLWGYRKKTHSSPSLYQLLSQSSGHLAYAFVTPKHKSIKLRIYPSFEPGDKVVFRKIEKIDIAIEMRQKSAFFPRLTCPKGDDACRYTYSLNEAYLFDGEAPCIEEDRWFDPSCDGTLKNMIVAAGQTDLYHELGLYHEMFKKPADPNAKTPVILTGDINLGSIRNNRGGHCTNCECARLAQKDIRSTRQAYEMHYQVLYDIFRDLGGNDQRKQIQAEAMLDDYCVGLIPTQRDITTTNNGHLVYYQMLNAVQKAARQDAIVGKKNNTLPSLSITKPLTLLSRIEKITRKNRTLSKSPLVSAHSGFLYSVSQCPVFLDPLAWQEDVVNNPDNIPDLKDIYYNPLTLDQDDKTDIRAINGQFNRGGLSYALTLSKSGHYTNHDPENDATYVKDLCLAGSGHPEIAKDILNSLPADHPCSIFRYDHICSKSADYLKAISKQLQQ